MPTPAKLNLDETPDTRPQRAERSDRIIEGGFALTQESNGGLLRERIEAIADGSFASPPILGFPILNKHAPLLPGSVVCLCGGAKVSKSFLVVQWLWQLLLAPSDVPTSMLTFEENALFHHWRTFAQITQEGRLCDVEWVVANIDKVRELENDWREQLDYVGAHVHKIKGRGTADEVLRWANREARCCMGDHSGRPARVLIVDPISFLAKDEKSPGGNYDHEKCVMGLKQIALDHDLAVILVTHPVRKRTSARLTPDLSNYSNGEVYGRAGSVLTWLEAKKTNNEITLPAVMQSPAKTVKYNRVLSVLGTRNTKNHAPDGIAMVFNGGNLWHEELGVIQE